MYGSLAELGSEGDEEEEEGAEAGGALPPTANLLLLRVRHCSLSHQSTTCSHTRTVKCTQRATPTQTHTRAEQV